MIPLIVLIVVFVALIIHDRLAIKNSLREGEYFPVIFMFGIFFILSCLVGLVVQGLISLF